MKKLLMLILFTMPVAAFAQNKPEHEIGLLLCLTGVCAENGQDSLHGAQLAVQELNARGEASWELITEDSREDNPSDVISGYRRLKLNPKIHLILGPTWTPAALALAPIAGRDRSMVMISPTVGAREFQASAENLFNMWPPSTKVSAALARYALQHGWKRMAVLSSAQPWDHAQGEAFSAEFKKSGGTLTAATEHSPVVADVKTEATILIASKPDAIFLADFQTSGIAARTLRRQGFKGQLILALLDETRLTDAQGSFAGAIYPDWSEFSPKFAAEFKKAFGMQPSPSAATAYDAVYALAEVSKQVSLTDAAAVSAALMKVDFPGVSGRIRFTPSRDIARSPVFAVVEK